MITFYTAVGQYKVMKNENGDRYPVIILNDREYTPGIEEMIVWSSLMWNIYTYDEIAGIYYRKEKEAHICGDVKFDTYLYRLESKGLVVSGKDYVASDALYNLISKLYIVPLHDSMTAKIGAFLHLTFIRRVPFSITKKIFSKCSYTPGQKTIMSLLDQSALSTAELIKCIDKNAEDISSDDKLMYAVYDDDDTTCDNIHIPSRFSENRNSLVQEIANLYLQKQILFQTI